MPVDRQSAGEATPEQVLDVLTHPDEIRRWSRVEFRAGNLEGSRLSAGTRTRVTGRLAGLSVSFDVEVHSADGGGFTGPLVASATETLLAAGALDSATGRIAAAAESQLCVAA